MNQTKQILKHLRKGFSITPMSATYKFNCWRLASRVAEIRAMGIDVKTIRMKTENGKTFARYKIA